MLEPAKVDVDTTRLANAANAAFVLIRKNADLAQGVPLAGLIDRLGPEPRAWTLVCRSLRAGARDLPGDVATLEVQTSSGAAPTIELVLDGVFYDLKSLFISLRKGQMPQPNPPEPAASQIVHPTRGLREW